jgi:Domain of unknown function (DUF5666)
MKRSLFPAGVIALALVAFIVAFIVAGGAAALAQRGGAQTTCAPKAQKCPSAPEVPSAKGTSITGSPEVPSATGIITSISSSTVMVEAKERTTTIHLTDNTTFKKLTPPPNKKDTPPTTNFSPASRADLAVGEVIEAQGTLNSDGSLQAAVVTISVTG